MAEGREYKGPGKITGAVGRGAAEGGILAGIGAAIGGLIGWKFGNAKAGAKWGAGIGAAAGGAHGAYAGMSNVGAAKEQLTDTQAALDEANVELEQKGQFVQKLLAERSQPKTPGRAA